MNVGVLHIGIGECISDSDPVNVRHIAYELSKRGYFVRSVLSVPPENGISDAFAYVKAQSDAVLVCGNTDAFYTAVESAYEVNRTLSTFLLNGTPCAVSALCDDVFLADTLIPMLNGLTKTYYATNVFRTVGKTEEQLRHALKDCMKNRNKIAFKFVSEPPECTVLVRYSNKTQKNTVHDLLYKVTEILKDCTYSYTDTALPERVAALLGEQNKTLGLAESFTGGNIAAALVAIPGISKVFKESIVCYDTSVKQKRLHVPEHILHTYGAVSIETAYEMAANLLQLGPYDYVIATTGNAGPTSEKPDENGVCYIAVGDKHNIDIFPCKFTGDRQAVIRNGVYTALYHLYKIVAEQAKNGDTKE